MELQTLMSTFSFKEKSYYFIKLLQYTKSMQSIKVKLYFDLSTTILENITPECQSNSLLVMVSTEAFSP